MLPLLTALNDFMACSRDAWLGFLAAAERVEFWSAH